MKQLIGNPMVFRQLPLGMALQKAKDLGYEALELWPSQIAECCTNVLRAELRRFCEKDLGLPLVRLNAADAPYFFPLKRKGDYRKILPGMLKDIDVTHSLGMKHLLSWEGRIPEGATKKDRFGWIMNETVELFQHAAEKAHRQGIHISVEVHPYTLGIDTDWLLEFFERVGNETFGVTYDCAHYGVGQPQTHLQAIERLGGWIKHIHFCDSDCVSSEVHFAPGTGCLDLKGIVSALKGIGFQGTLMQDLWLYPLPEEGAKIGVPYCKRVIRELNLKSENKRKQT